MVPYPFTLTNRSSYRLFFIYQLSLQISGKFQSIKNNLGNKFSDVCSLTETESNLPSSKNAFIVKGKECSLLFSDSLSLVMKSDTSLI